MRFTSKHFIYVLIAGVFTTNQLSAQQKADTAADIDYIRESNAWLQSENAAGLSQYRSINISDAKVYYQKNNGGFRNYYQSNDSQEYGLNAASYTRLTEKTVLAGGFGYQNFKGKNMSGSAFIDPYQNPFDIVELDAANRGTKELELYHIHGALSSQLHSKFSIGGKLDYRAGNYAKRKDLRHLNKLLNMDLTAGVLYHVSDVINIGLNYKYSRNIESISFKIAGNIDKTYNSLISYGSFYGQSEPFNESGFTDSGLKPLSDIRHGGALQLNLKFNNDITLFNEFSYADRNGFYGEDGTTSIMLTKHQGSDFSYYGQLSVKKNATEHYIGLRGSYAYLENQKTIPRRETTVGGVNAIIYYGNKDMFSGETINADLIYNLYLDVKNNQPAWMFNFTANYRGRNQHVMMYPYYRDQKINSYKFSGQLSKHYQKQKDGFNIGLGLGYGLGNGEMAKDETSVVPAEGHTPPSSMPQFLNEEYEFFTANRIQGNVALKYSRALQTQMTAYLKLNYEHTYAENVSFLGKHFSTATVSLGCNF